MPESMMMTPMPLDPFDVEELATLGNPSVSRNVLVNGEGSVVSSFPPFLAFVT